MSKLTVEVKEGVSAIAALRNEWQALYQAVKAPPFLSWEWMSTWQEQLNRHCTPLLLCARRVGRLVGLLALGREELSIAGAPLRRLVLLGNGFGGADYLDVLAMPGDMLAVTKAIFEHLQQTMQFDLLELDGLAMDSPSLPLLAEHFGNTRQLRYQLAHDFVCPQVELDADWPSMLKRSHRAENFKHRCKKARNHAGFDFRSVTSPAEAGAAFERFLQLHEPRWAGRGGSDFTGHVALRAFHRELAPRLAEAGLLRFDELWLGGACRASIYGLDNGQQFYMYNSGYDRAWGQFSPGLVLLGLSIKAAIERGLRRYDFLRGDENYKFDWSNTVRATVRVLTARRTWPVSLWLAWRQAGEKGRAQLKTLLPERLAAATRCWYREHRRGEQLPVVGCQLPVIQQ